MPRASGLTESRARSSGETMPGGVIYSRGRNHEMTGTMYNTRHYMYDGKEGVGAGEE